MSSNSGAQRSGPLRVLSVIKGLGRGGAEQLVLEQAKLTDRTAIDLHVAYVLSEKSDLVAAIEATGSTVHPAFGSAKAWPRELRDVLRRVSPDVVHCHSPVPAVLVRLATRGGAPTVYTEHNLWTRFRVPTRLANAATYRLDAHRFAVSHEVAASIGRRWQSDVEVLHHGIDVAGTRAHARLATDVRGELGIPGDHTLVVTVANTRPKKDLPTLLRAALIVTAERQAVTFVHVGSGPEEDQLHRLRDELGLGDRFRFLGKRDDAVDIIGAGDIFCLSSRHEGLPVTVMEAMAVGTPIVATNVGGIPEAVTHGHEGLLVQPADARRLAAALLEFVCDPARRAESAARASARAQMFDAGASVRRIEAVYRSVATSER